MAGAGLRALRSGGHWQDQRAPCLVPGTKNTVSQAGPRMFGDQLTQGPPAAFVQRISWINSFLFKKEFFRKGSLEVAAGEMLLGRWAGRYVGGGVGEVTHSLVGWPGFQGRNSRTCGVHTLVRVCSSKFYGRRREAYGRRRPGPSWPVG